MCPVAFIMPFKVIVPRNRNASWSAVRAVTMSSDTVSHFEGIFLDADAGECHTPSDEVSSLIAAVSAALTLSPPSPKNPPSVATLATFPAMATSQLLNPSA